MKKIIWAGRSSKLTKVGEVMTDEVNNNIRKLIFWKILLIQLILFLKKLEITLTRAN